MLWGGGLCCPGGQGVLSSRGWCCGGGLVLSGGGAVEGRGAVPWTVPVGEVLSWGGGAVRKR